MEEAARQYGSARPTHQQSQALVAAARAAKRLAKSQALNFELASALAQNNQIPWRATALAQLGHTYLTGDN
jgi:hypothetical protein